VAASIGISVLAGYLAFRNVQLKEVIAGIHQVDVVSIGLILILIALGMVGRSFRWGLMLEPLEPLGQRLLLPITSIGFLFIWIIPARLGEVARPYLLHQNSRVGLSAAMGSVVLERLIDASFLVVFLALCLPALRLPGWLLSSFQGFVYVLLTAALLVLLGSLPGFRNRLLQVISKLLPSRIAEFLTRIADTFYSGMQSITSMRKFLAILALTIVVWFTNLAAFMVMFRSMDLHLGWLAGITVLVLTCLGIALPAAPGFIGNYHYAAVVALSIFNVDKVPALALAILIHFLTMVVIVLMGVIFMNMSKLKMGFSFKSLVSSER
jgi:uncharacterized protein (TIRG00374 family)